jgi:hypothetical protein
MAFTGATGPNPPNYTKVNYANMFDMAADGRPDMTMPGVGANPNPPPYFDDGAAGPVGTFAANVAALASGTGATSGGTENSYPGTGTGGAVGAVPASTSVAHEAAGTETSVTNPGNITHTYVVGTMDTSKMYGAGPALPVRSVANAGLHANPNTTHSSSDSVAPAVAPTITGLLPVAPVSTGGTEVLTVNGTGFRNGAVVLIDGVAYNTQYNSPTQLKVLTAPKRTTAGNRAITVRVGATTTAATNWVFT